ncbi:nucleoside triphosphate pyrophosphohydrolase [Halomonas piscis]|uniref:Nucleoside triphosphate pyrophosphohydrolase n=1 Tax=Halomonas piscis TaxID=3031727 RepID=A0ABY9Z3A3_9GAMM|nr:nucleoside triphosphate pyrophosphohydrolase [Halomonas piscis]WNK21502.1 nucleoside triphosphate pyrophosphohydrolase [Halomonas piscis]
MRYTVDDLLTLMAVLRDPDQGCPWDIRQDWDSIVPHTLEEAYEVADAIERRAYDELPGELGDLLFQVVYYARFGEEEGRFDFADVVHALTAKMLRRHPHVFPDGTLESRRPPGADPDGVEQRHVKQNWEALKAREREQRARAPASALDDVPRALPALSRAAKLGKRAAGAGFDFDDVRGVMDKVHEELAEVEEALTRDDGEHAGEKVGDLLFAVTQLARRLKADPEQALRATSARFEARFRYVEQRLGEGEQRLHRAPAEELERCWQAAKRLESLKR